MTGDAITAASASDKVQQGLSEVRTTVLGGQILLGFQYNALFQGRFASLAEGYRVLALAGFVTMLAAVMLMIAPASFHQISEAGERSQRQARAIEIFMLVSLAPFGLGVGMNIVVATGRTLGPLRATAAAVGVVLVAAGLWYGIEIMAKKNTAPASEPPAPTSLKDQISDLMTEGRIVLPGVQALLGIQFLAFLNEAFEKLPAEAKAAHTGALLLLLLAMILLMTPPPFHRLAEDGRETQRLRALSQRCILIALALLSFAFAADLFVGVTVVTHDLRIAGAAAAAVVTLSLSLWFVLPLLVRRRG